MKKINGPVPELLFLLYKASVFPRSLLGLGLKDLTEDLAVVQWLGCWSTDGKVVI